MKPQCNTSADCLRELARVMDQFGIEDSHGAVDALKMVNSKYVKYLRSQPTHSSFPQFSFPADWQFAIAEVEGNPVFPYQEGLYVIGSGKFVPIDSDNRVKLLCDESGIEYHEDELTWNPPKPATVMVELPYDYARNRAAQNCTPDATLVNACKTALEKLKS